MAEAVVTLDDKYTFSNGRVYITGVQALVRLPLQQAQRDHEEGRHTAGYVSGYRGSPLGTYDGELKKAERFLHDKNILFVPGVNEDLAATAIWGTQQAELQGDGKYEGVFSIWYGKGPGVDRCGDVFRHANLSGSSKHGGVLVLAGDDHTCESSTTCHQSEYALVDAGIPVLSPASVQELLDYGLYGWALSRYSGCWVGLKCVKDIADATASVEVSSEHVQIQTPTDFVMPDGGLNIRFVDTPQAQEQRLHHYKFDAVRAFVRANQLDKVVYAPAAKKIGIVTHGKSYSDVLQALELLGLTEQHCRELGIGLYKVACTWPLEPQGIQEFVLGYEQIIVVEEKRGLVEAQIKEILYASERAPRIIGKKDERGERLLQEELALNPVQIALVIGQRLDSTGHIRSIVESLREQVTTALPDESLKRSFYFCAGCPHNSSTVLPEGSKGYAGIGCSWMAQTMDRSTQGYTHMGAEGMSWVGEAPFSNRAHMFQNIGDGTYFHSGLLAIRGAVSANTNITYKILFNDAVAMTGGQSHDGPLDPAAITRQVHAEGVKKIFVVTDEPEKYPSYTSWAPDVEIRHRNELNAVQELLRATPGVTVLVYDQTCAAEKRRRRKRKLMPTPNKRMVINEAVCEGCGDCGEQSNCVAILPLATELGRKREIDQSACNLDFSCNKGFCPSFVTVHGAKLKRGQQQFRITDEEQSQLVDPTLPSVEQAAYAVLLTGVGGTGIVTVAALLGMAAHIDGLGYGLLDMAGMAQKGGSVWSHLQFAKQQSMIKSYRIAPGGANAVLGCDVVVAASQTTLRLARQRQTRFLVNDHQVMTGEFTRNPDMAFPLEKLTQGIAQVVGAENITTIQSVEWAKALFGDTIAANMLLLGYAYQQGLLPIHSKSIEKAIHINGVAAEMNIQAFRWGRKIAAHPNALAKVLSPVAATVIPLGSKIGSVVVFRAARASDPCEKRTRHVDIAIPGGSIWLDGDATKSPAKILLEDTKRTCSQDAGKKQSVR